MLVIRFQRRGRKNRPFFKIVVTPKESPPKGKFLELLGSYDPLKKEKIIDKDRVLHWIDKGAQVSASVNNLLVREQVIEGEKVRAHSSRKRKKKERAEKPKAAPEGGEPRPDDSGREEASEAVKEKDTKEASKEEEVKSEKKAPAKDETKPEKAIKETETDPQGKNIKAGGDKEEASQNEEKPPEGEVRDEKVKETADEAKTKTKEEGVKEEKQANT